MRTGLEEMKTDILRNIKILFASFFFIFFFSLSFPLVIPGSSEPVWLHRAAGWLFIFPVMPLFFYVIDSFDTFKKKILALYAIGIPANALVFYWSYYSIHVYGGVPQGYTIFLCLLMFASESTFWLLFLYMCRVYEKRRELKPWIIASFWVTAETVRTFFPVDFYWNALGHSQYNNKLTLQWASIGAIYLLSFMIVWISMYIYQFMKGKRNLIEGAILFVTVTVLSVYSVVRITEFKSMKPVKEIKVGIMQPSLNQFDVNSKETNLDQMIEVLTEQINSFDKDTDLVVWHEAAMPLRIPVGFTNFPYLWTNYFPDAHNFRNQIIGLDMIDRDKKEFYNSAGFIQDSQIKKIYRKLKLAPFGEYLPMSDLLNSLGLSTIVPNTVGTFMRGTEHTVFDFGNFKASILICYDGTFSENVRDFVSNGAELLVNISNDAWFGYSSEIHQHSSFYPFRAVETGRTIIRATNVGVSGIVLPDGSIENATKIFERTTINRKVPIYHYNTIYLKYGNWFLYLVYLMTTSLFVFRFIKMSAEKKIIPDSETELRKKGSSKRKQK